MPCHGLYAVHGVASSPWLKSVDRQDRSRVLHCRYGDGSPHGARPDAGVVDCRERAANAGRPSVLPTVEPGARRAWLRCVRGKPVRPVLRGRGGSPKPDAGGHRSPVPFSLLAHNGEFTRQSCQTSAGSFVFCYVTTTRDRTRKRARASCSPPRLADGAARYDPSRVGRPRPALSGEQPRQCSIEHRPLVARPCGPRCRARAISRVLSRTRWEREREGLLHERPTLEQIVAPN